MCGMGELDRQTGRREVCKAKYKVWRFGGQLAVIYICHICLLVLHV